MSDPKSIFIAAIDTAESGPFPYVIYGGQAVTLWGEPRYTEDVDLILFLPEREAYKFLRAASTRGFAIDEDLAIQQIQVNGWARLPLGDLKSPWHLDMTMGDTEFDRSAFSRRREVKLFDRKAWIVSPEDLIIYKLISARDRDKADLPGVIKRQAGLDMAYLRQWADWYDRQQPVGLRARLEELFTAKRV